MSDDLLSTRRMTLRQLLSLAEKCSRDLAEQLQTSLLQHLNECRELSRPVRRRSAYPSMLALLNALQRLDQVEEEVEVLTGALLEQLEDIRQRAMRERVNR